MPSMTWLWKRASSARSGTGDTRLVYSAQDQSVECEPLPEAIRPTSLYPDDEIAAVPQDVQQASLGCGNPLAIAGLRPGEVVLDLGSGGGMDVFLAAGKVGPEGKAYGLDAAADMIALATANAARLGFANSEFLHGRMEAIPLPDSSVDAVISNCVISMAPDKAPVLSEAYRVLRPGGRLAVTDIVTRQPVPAVLKSSLKLWALCVAGALSEGEYRRHLAGAGFVEVELVRDREYTVEDAELLGLSPLVRRFGADLARRIGWASARISALKPLAAG